MVEVVRLTDSVVLDMVFVQDLFERAFAPSHAPKPVDALQWVRKNVWREDVIVLLALSGAGEFVGLLIADARTYTFSPKPWVQYLYSERGRGVSQPLLGKLVEWMRQRGIPSMRSMNFSGKSDEHMIETAAPHGCGKTVATVVDYDVREVSDE